MVTASSEEESEDSEGVEESVKKIGELLEQSFSANEDDSSDSDESEATEIITKSIPDSELSENGEDDVSD